MTTLCGNGYCRKLPTAIAGLGTSAVDSFLAGSATALLLANNGTILSWGLNSNGELGNLSVVKSPSGQRIGFVPAPILLLPR